jgi:hypothetical protein
MNNNFENLKDNKQIVANILRKYSLTKDSDGALIATFYLNELGGKDVLQQMSAFDLLKMLSEDKLTPASTIIRVRRKLQEDYIELRGKKYEERINSGEDTRKKIKNL